MTVSTLKQIIKQRVVPVHGPLLFAARNLLAELRISVTRQSARQFKALVGKQSLRVNLGCGSDLRQGWVNIDLGLGGARSSQSNAPFIAYDLRRGLPLPAGSCALIYSSHFFEHLTYHEGLGLMRDCYTALAPGGRFRVALPDFRRAFTAYIQGDYGFFEPLSAALEDPAQPLLADYMTYVVYQFGEHKCIYDEERAMVMAQKVGFAHVSTSTFEPGIDPDTPIRRSYSFYIDAVK